MMIQRPFSSGSRQAPDPHDNFLEQAGFYRKHTARDSSCLFRAISEQMYDTQNHHLNIRDSCVSYMRKNKLYFQNCLKQYVYDVDIDEYLDELSKVKTFGTLLELEAMAHMFARNIILFRPLELGHWFIYKPYFDKNFQIFVSHDRHFDTVYKNNFIEDAAFCQSIVYELLYKHVFKLPDITYAVESMLHASSFEEVDSTIDGMYCRQIYLKDGRTFELDMPENTCCILNNYELCHFHNSNFPEMAEMLQNEVNKYESLYGDSRTSTTSEFWSSSGNENNNLSYFHSNQSENAVNDNDYYDCNSCLKQLDSLLPQKYVSCVRQLLYEGITPFPYKVAKALDPDMYRNIEFDSWSEMRKEQRWKNWYTGGSNLQVGVKCQIYLRKQDEFYTGYIQEMPETQNGPCVVFIEDLGEKRTVPYDCLKPLPPDQVKPWPLPYRWQKQFEKYQQQQNQMYSPSKFTKRFWNHQTKCKIMEFEPYDMQSYQHFNEKDDINFKLKQYCNLDNFTPATIVTPIEIITLPLNVENDRTPLSSNTQVTQNKISQQTPLNNAINLNKKVEETPSRPPSSSAQQQQLQQSHQSQQQQQPQLQSQQQELIESTYLDDQSDIPIDQSSTIGISGINDGPCQYSIYNYYPEPYYAFHQFDNSIIHAASNGQQYYCLLPNSPSNVVPHTGQASVFMPSNHPLSPTIPCASAGPINSMGYYSPAGTQAYFPASTVLQPVISQPISSGLSSRQLVNHSNVNAVVQKSTLESGLDLPTDIATLRYFFNLGLDYYNELNNGTKTKDTENVSTKLAIQFPKIKIENESSHQSNNAIQEKVDTNNNVLPSSHSGSEGNNDQYISNHNQQNGNNVNTNVNNNFPSRNNNNNSQSKYNNNNRGGESKHFSSRCFNNRKGGNHNRNNGVVHNNRFVQGSQNTRGNNNSNSGIQPPNNNRNDNRNSNLSSASKGGASNKSDCYQKLNCNNNSNNTNEPDSSNVTEVYYGNKGKESLENSNQPSPISTTSENNDSNQSSSLQQNNISQSIVSANSVPTYALPYYTDHPNLCGGEQFATTVAAYNNTANANGIFVPQVIGTVPFGMCQTIGPGNSATQTYNTIQPAGVSHNTNYAYLTSGAQTGSINTSHPPPPLPTSTGSTPTGVPIQQATTYPMQSPHLQQQAYYYSLPAQSIPPPPPNSGNINNSVNDTSTSSIGSVSGDISLMNYTPEPTGSYPFMNFPLYYTPTNNGGLTPTVNNSTGGHGHLHSGGSAVGGNAYQGYWLAPAPVTQKVTVTTPTSNNKTNGN